MSLYDYQVKLLLVGDSGVGKTSLLFRFADHYFQNQFISTIGVDFRSRIVNHDGKNIKAQVWDTAGQDKFQSITSGYYRGAEGSIIVFDVTRRDTFDHIKYWKSEVDNKIISKIPMLLVGNKTDLVEDRVVSYEEANKLAKELQMPYLETSPKTNDGVDEIFVDIISRIIPTKLQTMQIEENIPKSRFNSRCC